MDLAMAVQEAHEGADVEGESASVSSGTGHTMPGSGSGSRSSAYGTEKRRTPDAVVTMSIPGTTKRGRYTRPPATAGWRSVNKGARSQCKPPFLGSEVPTEVGLGAPVVTVASVASMGIGPKKGGLPLPEDGRLNMFDSGWRLCFLVFFFYLPIVGISPMMGRFFLNFFTNEVLLKKKEEFLSSSEYTSSKII
jgi:hypothetical protein